MSDPTIPFSPYKGLIPYSEEDAPFFFGRDQKREVITANLQASRLTVLHGPSGVGKSSVLRAGVAYNLQRMAKQSHHENGNPEFAVVVFSSWRDDPVVGLTTRIRDSIAQLNHGKTPPSLLPSTGLAQSLKTWTDHDPSTEGSDLDLFIILDQFEEYFLYHPKEDGPGTLAVELPGAINRPDLRVNFLISIREDALAKLERFKGSIPHLFDNRLSLEHLDQEAAREAIIKPIDQYNRLAPAGEEPISIEPALVRAILDQIREGKVVFGQTGRGVVERSNGSQETNQIETPYLQLVMTRLWEEEMSLGSRELRLETLNRLGGSASIVRTHLDKMMDTLTPGEQHTASRIFYQLVTPSGTKIAHTVPDLAAFAKLAQDPPAPMLVELLAKLSDNPRRILRPVDPPPNQPSVQRYEIFHDVLAPAVLDWQTRYMQTVDQAKAEKRAAEEAAKKERDAAYELRVQQAEELAEVERLRAEEERKRFEAERERAEAQHLRAEEERKRFEAERQRAEEQQLRTETERQRASEQHRRLEEQTIATKRLRRLVAALAVMVIFTIAAAALAATKKISADNALDALRVQTKEAQEARDQAEKQRRLADDLTKKAKTAEEEAIKQARLAEQGKEEAIAARRREWGLRLKAQKSEAEALEQKTLAEKSEAEALEQKARAEKAALLLQETNREITAARIADSWNTHASDLARNNRFPEAISAHKVALRIFERVQDADGRANTLVSLAGVYSQQAGGVESRARSLLNALNETYYHQENAAKSEEKKQQYQDAEKNYQAALTLRITALNNKLGEHNYEAASKGAGDADPKNKQDREREKAETGNQLARTENSLGVFYDIHEQDNKAIPHYKRALEIRQELKAAGRNEWIPELISSYRNLAGLYQQQGHYFAAEGLAQKAIEESLAYKAEKEGFDLAPSYSALGQIYYYMGRYSEAEKHYSQTLQLDKNAKGEDHPTTATNKHNLALLYLAQGKYPQAESLEDEALKIYTKGYARDREGIALSYMVKARVYRELAQYAAAESLYKQAVDEMKIAKGNEHRRVAIMMHYLAQFYSGKANHQSKELKQAEELENQAIAIYEKTLAPDHWYLDRSRTNLALVYAKQGKTIEAEKLFLSALKGLEKSLGEDHPEVANNLTNLASLYIEQGKNDKAEPLLSRARTIREVKLGTEHPHLASTLNLYASALHKQGMHQKAEPLYKHALEIREKVLGPDHPSVAESLETYAALLQETGRSDEAKAMKLRAGSIRAKHARTDVQARTP